MKPTITLIAAVLSVLAARAAEVKGAHLLHTRNTTMAFALDGENVWTIRHYGTRIASADDVEALAWTIGNGTSDIGSRKNATYSVFGAPNVKAWYCGINKFGGLAVTHADGCLTTDLVAEGAETVADRPGAEHLVFRLRDRHYPFRVIQHFRALADSDVIETWVELENGEDGAVRLSRMDSLALYFPLMGKEFHLMSLTGQWACEGQINEAALARGQTIALSARSGVRDAWGANPSFMLSVGGKATEDAGRVIGGALCWSGMWDISVQRDEVDGIAFRAGASTAAGAYVLDAGRRIELPKFALTVTDGGKGQVSRNLHRWARNWRLPAGRKTRPVLLNSWEGSYFSFTEKVLHDMMDGVKEMGGELFVLDDGWFGKGKYARNDKNRDKVGLGDWVEDPEHIPNGLVALNAEANRRGLKFGFWVEPEMVNTNSWLYEAHPDWVIREKNRPLNVGRGGSQTVLDFSNPAVRDNIFGQLDALYSKIPGLAYIKWDANADFYNIGSTYLDAAHQANLPFDYTKGVYDVLARCRAKYPEIDIQACSSGGAHMDYGNLGFCDEFWGSDDSDARERVFIQWGALQFYPACTIGSHVTACPNHQTHRTTPLKFRFDVAMTGRFGFELHPRNLTPEELAFAKRGVADYKRIRDIVQQGDLYRLASPYENDFASLMYVSEDRSRAVVFLLGLAHGIRHDYTQAMRLKGLDAAKRYRVEEIDVGARRHSKASGRTIGGDALMSAGIFSTLNGDYDSAVYLLEAK